MNVESKYAIRDSCLGGAIVFIPIDLPVPDTPEVQVFSEDTLDILNIVRYSGESFTDFIFVREILYDFELPAVRKYALFQGVAMGIPPAVDRVVGELINEKGPERRD